MNQKSATPKDASAVILLDQSLQKVLWIQRNPALAFLGGWHAFPGGKIETDDAEIEVKNCSGKDLEKFKHEYNKINKALKSSYDGEKKLIKKGKELISQIYDKTSNYRAALRMANNEVDKIA